MLSISIKQPWCELIASGLKTLEHRPWSIKHRGDLLVVSARAVPPLHQHQDLPRGCAICIVTVTDCIPVGPKEFVWVLANPRRLAPVAILGRQRLWHVETRIGEPESEYSLDTTRT
jgi:hypothetical protein